MVIPVVELGAVEESVASAVEELVVKISKLIHEIYKL